MSNFYLVTGGTGFLGSALVRYLLQQGHRVRVLDNDWRGSIKRLTDLQGEFEFINADIRDSDSVTRALKGIDSVCHLAFINGTIFFYTQPELVLDIAVKGMSNVIAGCLKQNVGELILASSSEVYQMPPVIPTDEAVPLSIPDILNPRYSYATGKIISEALAINYGRKNFQRVIIFRPHNVYGLDMGWEHVIPQLALRMKELCKTPDDPVHLPIQGDGRETRAFVFIDDFIAGLGILLEHGKHLNIYNVGTSEEVTIKKLAHLVGDCFGRRVKIQPGKPAEGGTLRRCPDISKLTALGYKPQFPLCKGVPIAVEWYVENAHLKPNT